MLKDLILTPKREDINFVILSITPTPSSIPKIFKVTVKLLSIEDAHSAFKTR
jgi:hypothetical protein